MTPKLENVLVTGGSGFIGSNFIRFLFNTPDFSGRIINLDKLTYAGNPESLSQIASQYADRYTFIHGDITNPDLVPRLMEDFRVDTIVHFAAESHVDRSILAPDDFVRTNIEGTFRLLEAARSAWADRDDVRFHQVGTDEVFGSLGAEGRFNENSHYDPRSPYSASKAAADHLVRAYYHTYGLPVTLSNCSNNYGPYQFPEKLIPLMILNLTEHLPLPVYGDGANVRDWLYVNDHCDALWRILTHAPTGSTWCIGGNAERSNMEVVRRLCALFARRSPLPPDARTASGKSMKHYEDLITFVTDRPGHDQRYAMDSSHIESELGWRPATSFDKGIERTVAWYSENRDWVARVRSGAYREWIRKQYSRK